MEKELANLGGVCAAALMKKDLALPVGKCDLVLGIYDSFKSYKIMNRMFIEKHPKNSKMNLTVTYIHRQLLTILETMRHLCCIHMREIGTTSLKKIHQ